jgi:hypothetical protein
MVLQANTSLAVNTLNDLLRAELAAVGTYSHALPLLDRKSPAQVSMRICQSSHQDRALRLREEILSRGGNPESQSRPWDSVARIVESGAGDSASTMVIGALEAGENFSLREYNRLWARLDLAGRHTVSLLLYPQQIKTHRIISKLKTALTTDVAADRKPPRADRDRPA